MRNTNSRSTTIRSTTSRRSWCRKMEKKWGYFDIGDGIAAGATEELVWDKSTDNGYCEWHFKAVFDNKEESGAVGFNFCEHDLVLDLTYTKIKNDSCFNTHSLSTTDVCFRA